MTDEEKAKKYAITRTYPKFETSYIANFVLREVEGAFLAGLKAGRPEWHKVADGDLPKEDLRPRTLGYYLTASKHKSYKGFVFEVAYFTGVVFTKDGDILDNVIAWKEIVLPELPKEIE